MAIKKFIDTAIEGGLFIDNQELEYDIMIGAWFIRVDAINKFAYSRVRQVCIQEILLNPDSWKAVGKVEGWCEEKDFKCDECADHYKWAMHRMIDALCEGKTFDDFIDTLKL